MKVYYTFGGLKVLEERPIGSIIINHKYVTYFRVSSYDWYKADGGCYLELTKENIVLMETKYQKHLIELRNNKLKRILK